MSKVIRTAVVDDHDVVRAGLASTIENFEGFEVVGMASSIDGAKELIEDKAPVDLLIIDIALEESNSFNFVRNLKKKQKDIKVVFISGFSEEEFRQRLVESGGDGFWCKLEPLEKLWDLVKAVVEGNARDNGIGAVPGSSKPILSNREEQVISCIARGMTVKEIADKYGLSNKTVEAHKSNLMMKLCVHSQVDLVRWAIKNGVATA